jgi:hypothetical protein
MSTYYSREIETPKTMRDGLANVVQDIINTLEAGNPHEALLRAVDLLDDVRSNANPYRIDAPATQRKPRRRPEYRGTVNVD